MRILIINHEFPPVGGGAATACAAMAACLIKARNKVEILTSAFRGLAKEETRDGYSIRRIFSARKKVYAGRVIEVFCFILAGISVLKEKMRKERPEMVFAFFSLPSGFLALFLKKIYKIPYFVFLRGIDIPGSQGGRLHFLNRLFKPLIKYIWVNADKVIANSESAKKLALKTLEEKAVIVILNGVDGEFFCPPRAREMKKALKILYAGRLDPQKGLNWLLDAVAVLYERFPASFFVEIVGDGPQKQRLRKKSAGLRIPEKIVFSGWIPRKDLLEKYQYADIFVTPSFDESMPNAVLEAMACGLPIVASDIPAHKALIEPGRNGFLIPAGNSGLLAGALIDLLRDESLRIRMSRENVQKAKCYRWEDICRHIFAQCSV